jgi:hypothetical protein
MGDSQRTSGANPEFSATAKPRGICFEISPFEEAHGLNLNIGEVAYGFCPCPDRTQLSFPAEDVGIFDRASRKILGETRNPER